MIGGTVVYSGLPLCKAVIATTSVLNTFLSQTARPGRSVLDPFHWLKVSRLRRAGLRCVALRRPDHNSYFPLQSKSKQAAHTARSNAVCHVAAADRGDTRRQAPGGSLGREKPYVEACHQPGMFQDSGWAFPMGNARVRTRNAAEDTTQEALVPGRATCVLTRRRDRWQAVVTSTVHKAPRTLQPPAAIAMQ